MQLRRPVRGEEKLWLQVIDQAMRDLRDSTNPGDREEAREWFFDRRYIEGSIAWICSFLMLNPAYFRRKIVEMENAGTLYRNRVDNRTRPMRRFRPMVTHGRRMTVRGA